MMFAEGLVHLRNEISLIVLEFKDKRINLFYLLQKINSMIFCIQLTINVVLIVLVKILKLSKLKRRF